MQKQATQKKKKRNTKNDSFGGKNEFIFILQKKIPPDALATE